MPELFQVDVDVSSRLQESENGDMVRNAPANREGKENKRTDAHVLDSGSYPLREGMKSKTEQ
jgi:hypothetical protein